MKQAIFYAGRLLQLFGMFELLVDIVTAGPLGWTVIRTRVTLLGRCPLVVCSSMMMRPALTKSARTSRPMP